MYEGGNIRSLAKSILSILLAVLLFYLLIWRGWIFGIILGLLVIGIGFAIYFRVKMHRLSGSRKRDDVEQASEPVRGDDAPIIDDGRIQVTDLSDAREVDFEKE